jgi:hypothetical protein
VEADEDALDIASADEGEQDSMRAKLLGYDLEGPKAVLAEVAARISTCGPGSGPGNEVANGNVVSGQAGRIDEIHLWHLSDAGRLDQLVGAL